MKITRVRVGDGNDSIVVIRDLSDLSGGRTLDMSGWTGKDVRAGHIIIKKANGDYAPLGVDSMAYVDLSTGEEYAGVLKKSVTKKDPRAAIMTSGIVNYKALPYEIDDTIAAGLKDILFAGYVSGEEPGPTPPTPTKSPMYLEAAEANSTVSMVSTLTTAPDLEYSTDGINWQEWQHTTAEGTHTFDTITLGAIGDKVYLRGDNPNGLANMETSAFSNFSLTGAVNGGGNVMSMLDTTMELTEVPAEGFGPLFAIMDEGAEPALLTPPSMDTITAIGDGGCNFMYGGCTSLTAPADMPSLTTIGDIGCDGMYKGCSSLTSASNMPLLITIGDNGCDNMYSDCENLVLVSGDSLTFDFAPLPVTTTGGTTYSTPQEVAEWMQGGK